MSSTSAGRSGGISRGEADPETRFESEGKYADDSETDPRARKQNTRMNFDEVLTERLHHLKESRKGFKSALTRKMNEAEKLVSEDGDLDLVKVKAMELDAMMVKFKKSHLDYHSLLIEEDEREESQKYFDEVLSRLSSLKAILGKWFEETNQNLLTPFDSVSQADRHTSHRSGRSSVAMSRISSTAADARLRAAATRAALVVEAASLRKQQRLAHDKLRLEQEEVRLQLETQIAKAEAQERIYGEFCDDQKDFLGEERVKLEPLVPSVQGTGLFDKAPAAAVAQQSCKEETDLHQRMPGSNDANHLSENIFLMQTITKVQENMERQLKSQRLPKVELVQFDGNPLNYFLFITSFENSVHKCTEDSSERLQLLIQHCTGKAREIIMSCGMMKADEGYWKARKLLEERFGDKYKVTDAWIKRVSEGPAIRGNDRAALQDLADDLESCEITLRVAGRLGQINNEDRLVKILGRVPGFIKSRWQKRVQEIRKEGRDTSIEDVSRLIRAAAKEKNDPVFGGIMDARSRDEPIKEKFQDRQTRGVSKRQYSFSTQADSREFNSGNNRMKLACYFCGGHHKLQECTSFHSKASEEQLKFVRERKLCENCFSSTHYANGCKGPMECKSQKCKIQRKHRQSLHDALWAAIRRGEGHGGDTRLTVAAPSFAPGGNSTNVQNGFTGITRRSNSSEAWSERKALPIVPVKVKARGRDKAVIAYALLDSGSTCTWCTEKLMKNLGAEGPKVQVSLTTIEKENSLTLSSKVNLEIMDLEENMMIELPNVLTKEKLNISSNGISRQRDVDRWPHLKGIKLPDEVTAEIELLIGQDVPSALEPVEIRSSQKHGPYATKTKFGWTLNGPLGRYGATNEPHHVNFVQTDELLNQQFGRYINLEFNDSISEDKVGMSRDDKRALASHDESVRLTGGHYEIAVPWKECSPDLPNNKPLAEHRMRHLRKKLIRDPELFKKYSTFMDDLFEKGYARRVPARDLDREDGKVWYLPHHSVVHPQKPDKVRIVFDCAAKYRGVSLNDRILRGPDLTNKLVGVLLRFREEPVALMADVEAMYHQVRVRPDDVDVLRFLWFPNNDLSREPKEYQMLVHLFGGVWSPSCANFALLKTAEEGSDHFGTTTVQTVKRNFYVDDCLKSVKTEEEAIKLSRELRQLLAGGGFNLTKWISNSRKVLETIPVAERAKEVKDLDLDIDDLPIERSLGVFWNIETDQFMFKIRTRDKPLTRRGLLSVVSSVYDPMGFVCPFILPAKAILQDLCRRELGWDDLIPNEHLVRWQRWLDELPKLGQFSSNRCFKHPEFEDVACSQLHHFADASNLGYGAVTYLRLVDSSGNIACSFVMGKSRVAPLKQMTIPRLELSAATVAVRLDKMIRKELDMPVSESVFWTDSTAVLQYIENNDRRFHTFVANRLSIIHDASLPTQWRHVDTKRNPADDASRGMSAEALLTSHRWLKGPAFLWQNEESWPRRPAALREIPDDDPEVKLEARVYIATLDDGEDTMDRMLHRYSSWNALRKATAWILRYRSWLLSKVRQRSGLPINMVLTKKGRITVDETKYAEQEILKYIQGRAFGEELKSLKNRDSSENNESPKKVGFVKKSSPICSLDPVIVDGMLRVGGRLRRAQVDFDAKHQVILPRHHHVVDLIVRHCHLISGHSGQEYVLALLREKFWLIKGRVTVRKILRSCFDCRRRQGALGEQRMADLPADRVTPDKPPFTFVGVDCFGPYQVKRGRSMVKRYGVIFTCLVVRAVHIEVVQSMDTDSFLHALRRFIARRGLPEEIRSDNGGNFACGEKEMRDAIASWNQQQIHEFLLQREVRWTFNPPAASHMGGVWERAIRTTRKILQALLKQQTLSDESLSTLMCKVEAIINGRPLTKISDDPRDVEALTPNHLLFRARPDLPPGHFKPEDIYSVRRWKQVQYLADIFWRRWTKEYLPSLQQRQKWTEFRRNVAVGDVVLVADHSSPRCRWPLARVLEVHQGEDGCVRSAKVKTKSGTLVRPIAKLCHLEAAEGGG